MWLRTYLDDWLILAASESLCHTQLVLQEAQALCFQIDFFCLPGNDIQHGDDDCGSEAVEDRQAPGTSRVVGVASVNVGQEVRVPARATRVSVSTGSSWQSVQESSSAFPVGQLASGLRSMG